MFLKLFFDSSIKEAKTLHIATLFLCLGSTFNAEKDLVFDELGIINSINSESGNINKAREAFLEDFFADLGT